MRSPHLAYCVQLAFKAFTRDQESRNQRIGWWTRRNDSALQLAGVQPGHLHKHSHGSATSLEGTSGPKQKRAFGTHLHRGQPIQKEAETGAWLTSSHTAPFST